MLLPIIYEIQGKKVIHIQYLILYNLSNNLKCMTYLCGCMDCCVLNFSIRGIVCVYETKKKDFFFQFLLTLRETTQSKFHNKTNYWGKSIDFMN